MTHGERWVAALEARLAKYCKARGFRWSGLVPIGQGTRYRQFEIDIRDCLGNAITLAIGMYADEAAFLDDYGGDVADVSARAFDELTPGLHRRSKPSKRQGALFDSPALCHA